MLNDKMTDQPITVREQQSQSFSYNDRILKDKQILEILVNPNVFFPTTTTSLIIRAFRKSLVDAPKSILDLGCGCGIVSIISALKLKPRPKLFASDISESAIFNTLENAERYKLKIDCRQGSLFEPWENMKFDVIITDVPAISEPIARKTKWYPSGVPCDSGEDGVKWITKVLEQASNYMTSHGKIFFPVGSLSDEKKILKTARSYFKKVDLLEEILYPLNSDLLKVMDLINDLASKDIITLFHHGSRICWSAKIFEAHC